MDYSFLCESTNGLPWISCINYNHVDPKFAYGQNIEDDNVGDNFDSNDVNVETGADLVLKEFVQECHKRNLKVMMDFVPNLMKRSLYSKMLKIILIQNIEIGFISLILFQEDI